MAALLASLKSSTMCIFLMAPQKRPACRNLFTVFARLAHSSNPFLLRSLLFQEQSSERSNTWRKSIEDSALWTFRRVCSSVQPNVSPKIAEPQKSFSTTLTTRAPFVPFLSWAAMIFLSLESPLIPLEKFCFNPFHGSQPYPEGLFFWQWRFLMWFFNSATVCGFCRIKCMVWEGIVATNIVSGPLKFLSLSMWFFIVSSELEAFLYRAE